MDIWYEFACKQVRRGARSGRRCYSERSGERQSAFGGTECVNRTSSSDNHRDDDSRNRKRARVESFEKHLVAIPPLASPSIRISTPLDRKLQFPPTTTTIQLTPLVSQSHKAESSSETPWHSLPKLDRIGGAEHLHNLHKRELRQMRALGQFGPHKFIAARAEHTLYIIDQHAADERVRFEALSSTLQQSFRRRFSTSFYNCSTRSSGGLMGVPFLSACDVNPPQEARLDAVDAQALQSFSELVRAWGWAFLCHSHASFKATRSEPKVLVTISAAPGVFGRRAKDAHAALEGFLKVLRAQSISDFAHNIELPEHQCTKKPSSVIEHRKSVERRYLVHRVVPPCIQELIASHACRSAIKFGDVLNVVECQDLIDRLAACALPFQCAHGRPTIIPVVHFGAQFAAGQHTSL